MDKIPDSVKLFVVLVVMLLISMPLFKWGLSENSLESSGCPDSIKFTAIKKRGTNEFIVPPEGHPNGLTCDNQAYCKDLINNNNFDFYKGSHLAHIKKAISTLGNNLRGDFYKFEGKKVIESKDGQSQVCAYLSNDPKTRTSGLVSIEKSMVHVPWY